MPEPPSPVLISGYLLKHRDKKSLRQAFEADARRRFFGLVAFEDSAASQYVLVWTEDEAAFTRWTSKLTASPRMTGTAGSPATFLYKTDAPMIKGHKSMLSKMTLTSKPLDLPEVLHSMWISSTTRVTESLRLDLPAAFGRVLEIQDTVTSRSLFLMCEAEDAFKAWRSKLGEAKNAATLVRDARNRSTTVHEVHDEGLDTRQRASGTMKNLLVMDGTGLKNSTKNRMSASSRKGGTLKNLFSMVDQSGPNKWSTDMKVSAGSCRVAEAEAFSARHCTTVHCVLPAVPRSRLASGRCSPSSACSPSST
jgi:hypothetical protein